MQKFDFYYMIKIFTGTTETNHNIGLDQGVFTFTSEQVPGTQDTHNADDGSVYSTEMFSGYLTKIDKTTQKINIEDGGDYSNLNAFSFSLVNKTPNGDTYSAGIDALTEAYVVGSEVRYFIVTPGGPFDIAKSKWSGIISNISYDDTTFKISCMDKFMSTYKMLPKTTVKNGDNDETIPVVLGDNKYCKPLTIVDTRTVIDEFGSQAVLRIKPNIPEDRQQKWTNPDHWTSSTLGNITYVPGTYELSGKKRRYYHEQVYTGTELMGPNKMDVYDQDKLSNQYINGTEWVVVSHKSSFAKDGSYYVGKYIQFTQNKIVTDDELKDNEIYEVIRVGLWGTTTANGSDKGTRYCAFYLKEVPELFLDRTQFFGDGLNVETMVKDGAPEIVNTGEVVNEETIYFNLVDVQSKTIISNSAIAGIIEPETQSDYVYPKDNLKIYVKGAEEGIVSSIPVGKIELDIPNPYIIIKGGKYNDNKINSYVYLKPIQGSWHNIQLDHAEPRGYEGVLEHSLNIDSDAESFDWIAPGLGPVWDNTITPNPYIKDPEFEGYSYRKTNIGLKFNALFKPGDYDNYYILPNIQRKSSYTYFTPNFVSIYNGLEAAWNTQNAPITDWSASSDSDANQGNMLCKALNFEIRGQVQTFEGLRYSQNYNTSDDWCLTPIGIQNHPLKQKRNKNGGTSSPYNHYDSSPLRMLTTPLDIIPFKGNTGPKEGYMHIFPKYMKFSEYGADYAEHDRFWAEGFVYDTRKNLEFDPELFALGTQTVVTPEGLTKPYYNITFSITPERIDDAHNFVPTWDTLKLYNIGMLLNKNIDIKKDVYLKVQGEVLAEAEQVLVYSVRNTDGGTYDGEYVLNIDDPTQVRYYCEDAKAILYITGTSVEDAKWTISSVIAGTTTPDTSMYSIDADEDVYTPAIGYYAHVPGSGKSNTCTVSCNKTVTSINVVCTDPTQVDYDGAYYKVTSDYYQSLTFDAGIMLKYKEEPEYTCWGLGRTMNLTLPDIDEEFTQATTLSSAYTSIAGTWESKNGHGYAEVVPCVDSRQTNNVYNALKHMVSEYSTVSKVRYHNMPDTRIGWNVGRQINQKKNSFIYLRDLCKQSFVAGWVDGNGTVNFDAYRDQLAGDDTLVVHNSAIIIDGSIRGFRRSPLSKVYNEINVQYAYNPITQTFEGNYAINYVDEPSFPESTGPWQDYVQGIDSYLDAKQIWIQAHDAYLESKVTNTTPKDRSDLLWASDLGSYYNNDSYDRTQEYAYKYFKNSVTWMTRQKYYVTYSVPVTEVTKELEIMQRVLFKDPLLGNYTGWITLLTLDPDKDLFEITLTMEQGKARWNPEGCPDIVESGANTDTYSETGVVTDPEIDEGC